MQHALANGARRRRPDRHRRRIHAPRLLGHLRRRRMEPPRPVLAALRTRLKIPISVDTRKSEVAAKSPSKAARNSLMTSSGLKHDPRIADISARARVPLILMHMRGEPRTMQQKPFARDALRDVTPKACAHPLPSPATLASPIRKSSSIPASASEKATPKITNCSPNCPSSQNSASRSWSAPLAKVSSAKHWPKTSPPSPHLPARSEKNLGHRRHRHRQHPARRPHRPRPRRRRNGPSGPRRRRPPGFVVADLQLGQTDVESPIPSPRAIISTHIHLRQRIFPMRGRSLLFTSLLLCLIPTLLSAQLPAANPDPLHPAQAIQGAAGCSAIEASSCAQAAAKITPIVIGDSPLEENLRRLTDDVGGRVTGSPEMDQSRRLGRSRLSRRWRRCPHRKIHPPESLERRRHPSRTPWPGHLPYFSRFRRSVSRHSVRRHRSSSRLYRRRHANRISSAPALPRMAPFSSSTPTSATPG